MLYCGQTLGWIKMKLNMEVCLGPGDFVLDGDPAPLIKGHNPKIFGPCLLWPNGRPSQLLLSSFKEIKLLLVYRLKKGDLCPHLTQCGPSRGLPPCQVSFWFIQPFGHNTPTLQTGQRDRTGQRSDSIGRTVLQTVAQKPRRQTGDAWTWPRSI